MQLSEIARAIGASLSVLGQLSGPKNQGRPAVNRYDRMLAQLDDLEAQVSPQGSPSSLPETPEPPQGPPAKVSTQDTIAYQNREIGKDLLLLERHLQQLCQIDGTPCDCCQKHPMAIEALAEETFGMTGTAVYKEIADWAKVIAPITTQEASGSGEYAEIYPRLSMQARELRKKLMGTDKISALLTTNQLEGVRDQFKTAVDNL